MDLGFKISDRKLLFRMSELSGHNGSPKNEIDLFLTRGPAQLDMPPISSVCFEPVIRKPFTPDLEELVDKKAYEVRISKNWSFVTQAVCVYIDGARIEDGTLILPSFFRPYDKVIAGRQLRQAGQQIPLEIATGAFGMIAACAYDRNWLLYGTRARWTVDIGGPIQFVGVGTSEELDPEQRLITEIKEETGINRNNLSRWQLVGFSGSLKYWFDTGVDFAVATKPLADVSVYDTFSSLLRDAGGYENLSLPKLEGRAAQAFEEFGPVLDLGQRSKEHKRVFGLPVDKLEQAYVGAGIRNLMASYTRMQTARWLVDPTLRNFLKANV